MSQQPAEFPPLGGKARSRKKKRNHNDSSSQLSTSIQDIPKDVQLRHAETSIADSTEVTSTNDSAPPKTIAGSADSAFSHDVKESSSPDVAETKHLIETEEPIATKDGIEENRVSTDESTSANGSDNPGGNEKSAEHGNEEEQGEGSGDGVHDDKPVPTKKKVRVRRKKNGEMVIINSLDTHRDDNGINGDEGTIRENNSHALGNIIHPEPPNDLAKEVDSTNSPGNVEGIGSGDYDNSMLSGMEVKEDQLPQPSSDPQQGIQLPIDPFGSPCSLASRPQTYFTPVEAGSKRSERLDTSPNSISFPTGEQLAFDGIDMSDTHTLPDHNEVNNSIPNNKSQSSSVWPTQNHPDTTPGTGKSRNQSPRDPESTNEYASLHTPAKTHDNKTSLLHPQSATTQRTSSISHARSMLSQSKTPDAPRLRSTTHTSSSTGHVRTMTLLSPTKSPSFRFMTSHNSASLISIGAGPGPGGLHSPSAAALVATSRVAKTKSPGFSHMSGRRIEAYEARVKQARVEAELERRRRVEEDRKKEAEEKEALKLRREAMLRRAQEDRQREIQLIEQRLGSHTNRSIPSLSSSSSSSPMKSSAVLPSSTSLPTSPTSPRVPLSQRTLTSPFKSATPVRPQSAVTPSRSATKPQSHAMKQTVTSLKSGTGTTNRTLPKGRAKSSLSARPLSAFSTSNNTFSPMAGLSDRRSSVSRLPPLPPSAVPRRASLISGDPHGSRPSKSAPSSSTNNRSAPSENSSITTMNSALPRAPDPFAPHESAPLAGLSPSAYPSTRRMSASSYQAPPSSNNRLSFSSSARRSSIFDVPADSAEMPGPSDYYREGMFDVTTKRRDSTSSSRSFALSTGRDDRGSAFHVTSDAPAPGEYYRDNIDNGSSKRRTSVSASFGNTSGRTDRGSIFGQSQGADSPGPAQYYREDIDAATSRRRMSVTAAPSFELTTGRRGSIFGTGTSDTPGPAQYYREGYDDASSKRRGSISTITNKGHNLNSETSTGSRRNSLAGTRRPSLSVASPTSLHDNSPASIDPVNSISTPAQPGSPAAPPISSPLISPDSQLRRGSIAQLASQRRTSFAHPNAGDSLGVRSDPSSLPSYMRPLDRRPSKAAIETMTTLASAASARTSQSALISRSMTVAVNDDTHDTMISTSPDTVLTLLNSPLHRPSGSSPTSPSNSVRQAPLTPSFIARQTMTLPTAIPEREAVKLDDLVHGDSAQ